MKIMTVFLVFSLGIILSTKCDSVSNDGCSTDIFLKENEVRQAMRTAGMDHFMEKTNIVKALTTHSLVPFGVVMALELAFSDYEDNLLNGCGENVQCKQMMSMTANMAQMNKSIVLGLLLKQYPAAIACLKNNAIDVK